MSIRGTTGQRGPIGPPGTESTIAAPTNGAGIELTDSTQILILNPATNIASASITLPGDPTDGQVIEIGCTKIITVLTVSASATITGGGALTITALLGLSWRYIAALTTWVRRY